MRLARWFEHRRSIYAAEEFVKGLTRMIGPGFHPETPFADYLAGPYWEHPLFTAQQAMVLERALDEAYTVLEEAGIDPCGIGLEMQHRLLGWTMEDG